jgi:hypothetical protein
MEVKESTMNFKIPLWNILFQMLKTTDHSALFIDFEKPCDSVRGELLYNILNELGY